MPNCPTLTSRNDASLEPERENGRKGGITEVKTDVLSSVFLENAISLQGRKKVRLHDIVRDGAGPRRRRKAMCADAQSLVRLVQSGLQKSWGGVPRCQ